MSPRTAFGALVFVTLVITACSSAPPNPNTCGFAGDSCSTNNGCCTNSCNGGSCDCSGYGGDCAEDDDCCDLNDTCKTSDGSPVDGTQLGTCY